MSKVQFIRVHSRVIFRRADSFYRFDNHAAHRNITMLSRSSSEFTVKGLFFNFSGTREVCSDSIASVAEPFKVGSLN
jgi:hypothetical protein